MLNLGGCVALEDLSESDTWSLISRGDARYTASVTGSLCSFSIIDHHEFDVHSVASSNDCSGSDAFSDQKQYAKSPRHPGKNYKPPAVLRRPNRWLYGKQRKPEGPPPEVQESQDFSLQELSFIHMELLREYEDKFILLDTLRSRSVIETSLGMVNLSRYESFKSQLHEACLMLLFPPESGSARILWEMYPENRKQTLIEDKTNVKYIRKLLSIPIHLEPRFICQINCEEHWNLLRSSPYKLILLFGEEKYVHGPDEWDCSMCTSINSNFQATCKVCLIGKRVRT